VLVVTDHGAATPALLDAVRERTARGPAEFRILVTNPARAEWSATHPERHRKVAEAQEALAAALPLVEEVAGHEVEGVVSIRHDPMDAIEETLQLQAFDEIVLALPPHGIERRLHIDLPHRLAHHGMPITTISAQRAPAPV
jgi:hypothetical protein